MDKAQVLEKFPITQDSTVYDIPARPGDLHKIVDEPWEDLGALFGSSAFGSISALGVTSGVGTFGVDSALLVGVAGGIYGAVISAAYGRDAAASILSKESGTLSEVKKEVSFRNGFRNYALSQFPNIAYAFNNPDETAIYVGALTGLAGAAIEPIQIYKQAFDKRFDLFQGHVKDQVIPNTSPLLHNTVEQNPLDLSPKEIFDDYKTIANRAFPNNSAWGFSRHSDPAKQNEYKQQIEKVMDLSQPFRNEYKIEI